MPLVGRLLRHARKDSARRVGWGFVDQALSSLTNFAVSILIARSVSPREFGMYALVYTVYLLALGVSRSLTTDPFMIRYTGKESPDRAERQRAAAGAAFLVGATAAVLLAVASFLFGAATSASMLAFAVVLPGLLLQDAWRVIFFALGRPQKAALNDLIWGVAQIAFISAVLLAGAGTVPNLVLAWGGSAAVAALAGVYQARSAPDLIRAWSWVRDNRDLGIPFVGEFLAARGGSQVNVYGLAAVASLSTVGILKAGQIFMGPLNVLQMGLMLSVTPEVIRLRDRSITTFRRALGIMGSTVCGIALAWGAALALMPTNWGRAILGDSWALAYVVILPLAAGRAAQGLADAATTGLRVLGAAKLTFRLRLVVVALGVAGTLLGGWRYGALGAAIGGSAALWIGVVLWWAKFLQVSRAYRGGAVHALADRAEVEGPSEVV